MNRFWKSLSGCTDTSAPDQVLGVRMSMLGVGQIGAWDPKGRDRKNLIVFVEMDRCATVTDAARVFLRKYELVEQGAGGIVDRRFKEYFGDIG